jgi:hypothetical protein
MFTRDWSRPLLAFALVVLTLTIWLSFGNPNPAVLAEAALQIPGSPTPLPTAIDVQSFTQLDEVWQDPAIVMMDVASTGFPVILYAKQRWNFIRCLDATCTTRTSGTLPGLDYRNPIAGMALDGQDRIVLGRSGAGGGRPDIAVCRPGMQ